MAESSSQRGRVDPDVTAVKYLSTMRPTTPSLVSHSVHDRRSTCACVHVLLASDQAQQASCCESQPPMPVWMKPDVRRGPSCVGSQTLHGVPPARIAVHLANLTSDGQRLTWIETVGLSDLTRSCTDAHPYREACMVTACPRSTSCAS